MTEQKPISSWMWATNSGDTNGVTIDLNLQMIYWFDAVGCACASSTFDQPIDDYRANGSPLGALPEDVIADIDVVLTPAE